MNYFAKKEERAKHAKEHTEMMQKMYPKRIQNCIDNSVVYGVAAKQPVFIPRKTLSTPEVIFANEDSVSALMHYRNGKTAVLNYASYKNPGGMFIEGSSAQEESLCHESFLYNVLREMKEYYSWNNTHKNKALYLDRAVYTPGIVFAKGKEAAIASVITCAAPNYKAAAKYGNVKTSENENCLKTRLFFIRDIAETEEIETLVTGAYGCGVFGQDPEMVAKLSKEVFAATAIKRIVYAVPGKDRNAEAFKKAFV